MKTIQFFGIEVQFLSHDPCSIPVLQRARLLLPLEFTGRESKLGAA